MDRIYKIHKINKNNILKIVFGVYRKNIMTCDLL